MVENPSITIYVKTLAQGYQNIHPCMLDIYIVNSVIQYRTKLTIPNKMSRTI